jgi:hypothetical protein
MSLLLLLPCIFEAHSRLGLVFFFGFFDAGLTVLSLRLLGFGSALLPVICSPLVATCVACPSVSYYRL